MNTDVCFMPAVEQAQAMRRGDVSPVEVVDAVLAQISLVNPKVNAFVIVLEDEARAAAKKAEEVITKGDTIGKLEGVPFTLKDVTQTEGIPTTFGSKAFANNIPTESGPMYQRLLAEGGILIGKTATPEMAFKGVTDSPLTGFTNNPWDPSRTVGGSSGGAAASVACGMGALATGSDGGGSIRTPASFCGVVGLKPSCGRIPIYLEDYVFETTTQVGPITRTVADAALMLSVLAGPDERDPFSIDESDVDYLSTIDEASVRGLRVAYSPDLGLGPVQPEVAELVARAAKTFGEDLGADVEEVTWELPDPVDIMRVIWPPVCGIILDDLLSRETRGDVDASIVQMAAEGADVSAAAFYRAGVMARSDLYQQLTANFLGYDLLLTPTLPVVPFVHPPLGGQGPDNILGHPIWPYSGWLFLTAVFNFTGHPAITVPCGFSSEGLPIGLQIVGHPRADRTVLAAAAAYEGAAPWVQVRPPVAS